MKQSLEIMKTELAGVTLRVRVWIETLSGLILCTSTTGHPPREGVD